MKSYDNACPSWHRGRTTARTDEHADVTGAFVKARVGRPCGRKLSGGRFIVAAKLTDTQIRALLDEVKPLGADYRSRLILRPKRGHSEQAMPLIGDHGASFQLILRQSLFNVLDFSVILAYRLGESNQLFRLRRYNGRSHEHFNPIENESFYAFHIHTATQRYQEAGFQEDTYAEPSADFGDIHGAIGCLLRDCAFEVADELQPGLFSGGT